ncbi:Lrp/AsnC family transcriptional regulator [Candidatus Bathyarchaeota archaeon]|nr:Lrp/AsnC family transcriptional regulator [Candidatus Bathyarchaeota archaeon]
MSLTTLNKSQPFHINKHAEAFMLITTAPGEEKKVLQKLMKFDALTEAHAVNGSYDILAKFRTENYERLKGLLKMRIKKIEGVKRTRVLLVV